ncbi:MAG: twin-arginine translocase TatA/TatE family subunit [Muribaculaceae bacterium]|nr:twin-arginine translocase TatA/TatE family subunit [Muribaculaceae bacterium]MCM1441790.1 twin-arginine translocase TatA/TatE family subunit [Roseburia sp.]
MRPGWTEIILILILVVILFGHNKIPGMMKNLAGGIKVFKKELKEPARADTEKKPAAKKVAVKKAAPKKVVAKKETAKKVVKK